MIKIEETSGIPIYLQIVLGMKREILTGIFGPGEKLPSIRDLAIELKVNPNTIAKAYQEMETNGIIFFKRGQGAYVSPRTKEDRMGEAKLEILHLVTQIQFIAKSMGINKAQLREIIQEGLQKPSSDEQTNEEGK
ncbi:GntR family transcriptional regulator [bacterium]|nr:GntR family transcriptional regulator [bacterium]